MTVSTYNPADHVNCDTHAPNFSTVADKTAMDTSTITNKDDIVHLMPTLTDLKKPHSDQEFIEKQWQKSVATIRT